MSMIGTRLLKQSMLIQLDGGEEPQGKGWKSSYKSRQQSNYNPGGQRSWAFPIEEEWSSYEGENDEIYAVEDWQEEQVEDDIPVYEVEEDIQYDIEEMEHAIEVTTVEDLSFDELDVFAATIQKMGKGASEYARKRQPVRDGKVNSAQCDWTQSDSHCPGWKADPQRWSTTGQAAADQSKDAML